MLIPSTEDVLAIAVGQNAPLYVRYRAEWKLAYREMFQLVYGLLDHWPGIDPKLVIAAKARCDRLAAQCHDFAKAPVEAKPKGRKRASASTQHQNCRVGIAYPLP